MAMKIAIESDTNQQFGELPNSSNKLQQSGSDINANINLLSKNEGKGVKQDVAQSAEYKNALSEKFLKSVEQTDVVKPGEKQADLKEKALEKALEVIESFMNLPRKNVNFAQHESSDKTIIKVFDAESQELIRQFPSEEALEIAQKIVELREDVGRKTGILLDEKV